MESLYHVPVLLEESVSGLNIDPEGVYLDLTFGGGGHSREILRHLGGGCLIGFDQDSDALANVTPIERTRNVETAPAKNEEPLKRFMHFLQFI